MVDTLARDVPVLRVALLQLLSAGPRPEDNLVRGIVACRQAAAAGADLAVFPELWQVGYALPANQPEARGVCEKFAIGLDDRWLEEFRLEARRLNMAVVTTFLQRWPGAPRNAAVLIDRTGHDIATYAKVHTCDFSLEAAITPGDKFCVASLDTRHGPVQVGIMICYDREFPESARTLMLEGAEVVVTPNACDLNPDRVGQFRARAFENMLAVAMANYPVPQYNGHSCAFDGVAFQVDGRDRDHKLVEAGPEPGVVFADIDLALLRGYRARETWGDAYRKPYAYQSLVSPQPRPPFVRHDARRTKPLCGTEGAQ